MDDMKNDELKREELQAYLDAAGLFDKLFPLDKKGKYARPMAKKLADNTDMTYQEAVDLVYNSVAIGVIDHLARSGS